MMLWMLTMAVMKTITLLCVLSCLMTLSAVDQDMNQSIDLQGQDVKAETVLPFVNKILQVLNPDCPPQTLGEEQRQLLAQNVRNLSHAAQAVLAHLHARIDAHANQEAQVDNGVLTEEEGQAVIRKAVSLRLEWADAWYFSFLAMREVQHNGKEYGIAVTDAELFHARYLDDIRRVEEYEEWDWVYGDYLLLLRHRLLMMQAERVLRDGKSWSYAVTISKLQELLDTDLDVYPQEFKESIFHLQMDILNDVLLWHVGLHKRQLEKRDLLKEISVVAERAQVNYIAEGLRIWKHYRNAYKLDDIFHGSVLAERNRIPRLYFTAFRLRCESGADDVDAAMDLIAEIVGNEQHDYYSNARRWKDYLLGDDEEARLFIERAINGTLADLAEQLLRGVSVNVRNNKGVTAVYRAAYFGKTTVVQWLIAHGADVNPRSWAVSSPLHIAALRGKLETVKVLVESGANVSVRGRGRHDGPPLFYAITKGNIDIIKYLLAHGADIQVRNSRGSSAIIEASILGDLRTIQYLVEKGAVVNIADNKGNTPLFRPSLFGNLDIVKYFVDNGVSVQAQSDDGNTALHYAAQGGDYELIEYLIDEGASVAIQNNQGDTPMHVLSNTSEEYIRLMLEAGADASIKNKQGETILDHVRNFDVRYILKRAIAGKTY